MRFERLQIPAFGPFTDVELQFPGNGRDLHLIYGDNEAGKSSLLRAFRDLLFGIHGQSPDNFLHDYKNLRLVGEIVNRAGERLVFQRRKGNKNTLLDLDDNPLPDTALLPFLGSVDQSYFSAMFGLGGSELREGAKQLLRGEGEVGNALFSASLGGTPIQRVLESLVAESERIYKGRATANVSIRPAVNRYKELLKQSRESMVHPDTWEALEKELAERASTRQQLEDELAGIERELNWLARCEDALPCVGRLNEESRLLQGLPELPEVADDFVERARGARNTATEAGAERKRLETHVIQLNEQLAECATAPDVMAQAEALDILHQDLGAHRHRQERLKELQSKLAGLEPVLTSSLKSLQLPGDLNSLEKLRPSRVVWLNCQEAAKGLKEAMAKRDEKERETQQLKRHLKTLEAELRLLPEHDLTQLRESLAVAAEATDAHKTWGAAEAEVQDLRRELLDQHALVLGAPEDPDATARLAVPASATLRKFRERFDRIRRDIEMEEDRIAEERQAVKTMRQALDRLERRGELPSEETLQEARSHRDHGWRLVLSEWKGDGAEGELVPGTPLEQAFPQAILQADHIVDRLRQEADAVAQAAEKRSQIAEGEESIAEADRKLVALRQALEECQDSWRAEWACCGIEPRPPEEMEEWREAWAQFRETLRAWKAAEAAVKTKAARVKEAKVALAAALNDSAEKDFSVLYHAAMRQVRKGEASAGRRSQVAEQIEMYRKQLARDDEDIEVLSRAVGAATAQWEAQCQSAGLPEGLSCESGLSLLEERKQLLVKFDSWKELSGEAERVIEALRHYEQEVRAKAAVLSIHGDTAESQAVKLWEALERARKAQTEHDQLAKQIRETRSRLIEARQAETQANQVLQELLQLARLSAVEELEPLLANLEKRNAIQRRTNDLRGILIGLARGEPVDAFMARVQAENADELPHRKAQLEKDRARQRSELHTIQDECLRLNQQKHDLERAGDASADCRQQAESVAATIKQDASRFFRLRLAAHFLRHQIERFREQNQAPLLEKSGQVFKQITRGAFEGLGAEFNAEDVPVLMGCRPDGSRVSVDGMSDGSRDQLYLALRLAALNSYLEDH